MSRPKSSGAEIARDNHYLPQFYQRNWSGDGASVSRYRLLVSDERVPAWDRPSIKGIGYKTDLYTSVVDGSDSDALEAWFGQEVEDPAAPVLLKVAEGRALTRADRRHVTLFAMAMDVRTPRSYLLWRERTLRETDGLLRQVLERIPDHLAAARRGDQRPSLPDPRPVTPIRVKTDVDERGRLTGIGAEIIVGREMWLWSIRYTLTEAIRKVPEPNWIVLRAAEGQQWFTSDQPLLRLGYTGPDSFTFGGGWGRPGCEVVLPISPAHLLYFKVGQKADGIAQLSRAETYEMQRLLALRAWREIVARERLTRVERFRPRVVNREVFEAEAAMWRGFHEEQTKGHAETD